MMQQTHNTGSAEKGAFSATKTYFSVFKTPSFLILALTSTFLIIFERLWIDLSGMFAEQEGFMFTVFVFALRLSSACSILTVFALWLTPAAHQAGTLALTACRWLLKTREYAWYAIGACVGVGYINAMQIAAKGTMQQAVIVLFFGATVVFAAFIYAVIMRSLAIIVQDISQTMHENEYLHAFGHTCGIVKQCIVMLVFCVMLFFCRDQYLIVLLGFVPTLPLTHFQILYDLWGRWMPVVTVISGLQFIMLPRIYTKYMRASVANKTSAVDAILSNTPENATTIYTSDH